MLVCFCCPLREVFGERACVVSVFVYEVARRRATSPINDLWATTNDRAPGAGINASEDAAHYADEPPSQRDRKTVYYLPEENPEYIGVGHDTIQYSRMRSSGD